MGRALLIGTLETKEEALRSMQSALEHHGLQVEIVDVSLRIQGRHLSGAEKLKLMETRAKEAAKHIAACCSDFDVAVGIGGGTGSEIVVGALKGLPATYRKMLITTLASDPRPALADSAITLVPTLCDIEGMNSMLEQVFRNAAAMVAGLAQAEKIETDERSVIAITSLGATGQAASRITKSLRQLGYEACLFHSNGYGGAAYARFLSEGRATGTIDLNVHELGRVRLAGAHIPMPNRFSAGNSVPRVVLPGALNFLGLGALQTVPQEYRERPHYRHTEDFTHVKLTADEMAAQAQALADALNQSEAFCSVLIPMGGFSHEDRPGGALEDKALREIAADTLSRAAKRYRAHRLPHHINDPETAEAAVLELTDRLDERRLHA